MATVNPATRPGGRLHLFGLPGELRDMIFELAYYRPADITLTRASAWRSKQSMQRQLETASRPFVPRPYPGSTVSRFLVSKRYFVAAARAYVSSTPLIVDKNVGRGLLSGGVLAAFARQVECNYEEAVFLRLPNLKILRATVRLHLFGEQEESNELPVLKQKITEAEFERSIISRVLRKFEALKTLELIPQDAQAYGLDATQKAHWEANVKVLEAVVARKVVTSSSDQPAHGPNVQGRTPLYTGSNVSFEPPPAKHKSPLSSPPPTPPPQVSLFGKPKASVQEQRPLPTVPTKSKPAVKEQTPLSHAISLLAQVCLVGEDNVRTLIPELLDKLEQIRRNGHIEPNQSFPRLTPPATKRFVPKELMKRSGVWLSNKEYGILCAGLKAKSARLEREQEKEKVDGAMKLCETLRKRGEVVGGEGAKAAVGQGMEEKAG